ncbi:MAG: chain-length determining protein, partial [Phocaeicola sp.]
RRKLFYKVLPITFVLSCAIILCVPRYYTSSLSLAPELGNSSGMGGAIGSLASSFGFDLGSIETTDAINPTLYPDLMEDNGFVVGFFDIRVKSQDGEINCTYYEYLTKHQKYAFWTYGISWLKKLFQSNEAKVAKGGKLDPYVLTKRQDDICGVIRKNISLSVDKKTAVISISVQAQDALICKTLADSVKERLQTFITNYRTNKSRIDEQYYKELADEAKADYEQARRLYAGYADANMDVMLESYRAKQNDLENDMQLKYNTYTTLMTQYQAAKAKVQERTPAFTLVQGASVPIKPTGPKRMLFVIGMCMLAFFIICFYILKEDIKRFLLSPAK